MRRFVFAVCLAVFSGVALPARVTAQALPLVPFTFDFVNPGARSLAIGGAFAGLSDDATAAVSNPAGLFVLQRPEFSIEVRGRRNESEFLSGGRVNAVPSRLGIDTIGGPLYDTTIDSGASIPFASVVYPRGNWAISAYRQEAIRIGIDASGEGAFAGTPGAGFSFSRGNPFEAVREATIVNYGGVAAFRFHPAFAVGASVFVSQLDFFQQFEYLDLPADRFTASRTTLSTLNSRRTAEGDSFKVGASVGVMWTPIATAKGRVTLLQLGGVYRYGPAHDVTHVTEALIGSNPPPPRTVAASLDIPDVLSVGGALRLNQQFLVAAEVERVRYSELSADAIVAREFIGTSTLISPQFEKLDDVTEFRVGAEYVFSLRGSPALRGGLRYEPAHAFRVVPGTTALFTPAEYLAAAFPPAESLTHLTFGGGASLSPAFEVNVGADISAETRTFSVSTIIRLAR